MRRQKSQTQLRFSWIFLLKVIFYLYSYCYIIVIIILDISFKQGIHIYIPETNHVPREHCVATILM
jgi:hypothetical protein